METTSHILANLMDEEAGNPHHPELWLEFAESLGLNRKEVANATPSPADSGFTISSTPRGRLGAALFFCPASTPSRRTGPARVRRQPPLNPAFIPAP